jgi:hypothetical protein
MRQDVKLIKSADKDLETLQVSDSLVVYAHQTKNNKAATPLTLRAQNAARWKKKSKKDALPSRNRIGDLSITTNITVERDTNEG